MKKASLEEDYNYLTDRLYELGNHEIDKKEERIQYIIENDFFFPRIDNNIDGAIWNYCTQVAHVFNSLPKYKNEFSYYLDSLDNPNCPNESLKHRIQILKTMS